MEVGMSFKSVESICNQARRAALPKSVKTADEINDAFKVPYIWETYGRTYRMKEEDKTPFFKYAYNGPEFSFCIFASDDIIKAIEENVDLSERKIYTDGTFKICPMGDFKQVVMLFADLHGYVSIVKFSFLIDRRKRRFFFALNSMSENC